MKHQKIVRAYMNPETPYRGILLYHGLGSGKTCSAIAITEQFKQDKKFNPADTLLSIDNGHMYKFGQKGPYMNKSGILWKHVCNEKVLQKEGQSRYQRRHTQG